MGVRSYKILDQAGVNLLSTKILREVNNRIEERITTSPIMNPGDDLHVPSVSAVATMIARSKFVHLEPVVGDINDVIPIEDRDPTVIYLQKDDLDDPTWSMYIWTPPNEDQDEPGYWIALGTTDPEIAGYWAKTDESIAELYQALQLDDKVDRSDLESYTEEEIKTAISDAISSTEEDE